MEKKMKLIMIMTEDATMYGNYVFIYLLPM